MRVQFSNYLMKLEIVRFSVVSFACRCKLVQPTANQQSTSKWPLLKEHCSFAVLWVTIVPFFAKFRFAQNLMICMLDVDSNAPKALQLKNIFDVNKCIFMPFSSPFFFFFQNEIQSKLKRVI